MATINSNMTRITGMASGLDIDSLVKTGLKPYQTKVDQKTQQKEVAEIKQKLYRDLLTDSKNFYNKYFDILGKDNLISSSNYKSVKFTPSSDAVSIVASNNSQQDNYKVTVTEIATAASAVISGSPKANDKITVNGKEFTLVGANETEIAKDLTTQLAKAGIKVAARYTDFAGTVAGTNAAGMILESTMLGKDSTFTVGTNFTTLTPKVSSDPLISNVGADATAAKVTGFNVQNVKDSGGSITIDYDGAGIGASVDLSLDLTGTETDADILSIINSKLDSTKVVATKDDTGNITFSSTVQGTSSPQFSIKIGATTTTASTGTDATASVSTFNDTDILGGKIIINGNAVDLTSVTTEEELNELIQDKGVTAKINGDNTITFTSVAKGASSAFTIAKADGAAAGLQASSTKPGVDANVTIENLTKGGTYTVTGNKNTVILDGSAFTFNDKTVAGTPVTIIAKKDATELKDKIVKFISDYNTMIEKLNKTVMTKHTRGYDPLTSDQKKDLSDDEVKLWNQKVEAGQLYRDDDISRISSSMKESMRTLMSSTGLNLEKIGIVPVKDYASAKNGTFSIPDESKLQTALEENTEEVMDLFTRKAPTKAELDALPDEAARIKRKDQTGIFIKLKNIIYSETMSSDSSLAKKVGIEGTGTFTSNTLTKSISDYEKKIKDMQKSLASREQSLYTKYSYLEKILNQYNAQQSSLTSSLGS